MAMSSGGNSGGPMSEINVTPLVDVMLVLLIIFMITAPLMSHTITVELPKANPKSKMRKSRRLHLIWRSSRTAACISTIIRSRKKN
jgi:biopolymer transport protein ExbD